jgi:LacI family transcriptional regulator
MILVDDRGSVVEELEAAKVFVGMRVAGVIVTPLSADITSYLTSKGVPVVEADRTFTEGDGDAVLIDNVGVSRRLVDLLVDLGHTRIALLSDEREWTTGSDRLAGYRSALTEAGVDIDESLIVSTESAVEDARRASVELLGRRPQPTAVFAVNNVLAEGVWRAATDLGLHVPDDLSIVSFDDAPWMTMVTPGMTAVAQDVVALGEAAMTRLLSRMEVPEAPPKTVVVDAQVLSRGSTAAPRTI